MKAFAFIAFNLEFADGDLQTVSESVVRGSMQRTFISTPKTCPRSMYHRPLLRIQKRSSLPLRPGRGIDGAGADDVPAGFPENVRLSCSNSSSEKMESVSGDMGRIGAEGRGAERKPLWLFFLSLAFSRLGEAGVLLLRRRTLSAE